MTEHRAQPVRHHHRRALAVAALAAAGLVLSGCQAVGLGQQRFAWADAAAGADDVEWNRIPELVPDDATDVRLLIETTRYGAQLSFESEDGITADYCEPGPIDGASEMDADDWPATPDEGWVCGWWTVFEDGGRFYAWDSREGTDT